MKVSNLVNMVQMVDPQPRQPATGGQRRAMLASSRQAMARVALTFAVLLSWFGAGQALAHPAQDLVESSVNSVLTELQANPDKAKNDPGFIDGLVRQHIVPHLDFESMTKLSVSKHWRKASADQRQALVTEFTQFLLNTYVSALSQYGGESMEFKPYRAGKREDRAVVESLFKQSGSSDVAVVYKLHNRNEPWQVYDIVVSDLSLVLQYKSSFASEIERNGIDGLLKLLREKNSSS